MDAGSWADWVSAGANVVIACSAIAVSVFGVRAWHRESMGKRKLELAVSILENFYNAEDSIKSIRFPVSSNSESFDRPKSEVVGAPLIEKKKDIYYRTAKRVDLHADIFISLKVQKYLSKALFGAETSDFFDAILKIRAEILAAAQTLFHHAPHEPDDSTSKLEKIIYEYSAPDEPDQITERVKDVINKVEQYFRRYVTS